MSAQPSLAIYRLNLYNPGRMTDAEIVAAFIARRSQFDRIAADLAAESATSRAQHHLIVGQRGMGKTTLLLRLAAELRGEPLGERFLPLVFSEEQYAVDRLSKFWMNCLDSLADALERTGGEAGAQKTEAQKIDVTVRKLQAGLADRKRAESDLAREALDAFLEAAGKTQRRPVLLVDNIQLVFENLDDQQQHVLREVLQRPGAPVLVAASPAPPPESQDYGAAFYDQFKTYYLAPLDLGEMRELLAALAKSAGRDDVAVRVRQNPGRIAALHQLTGGNPRTTVLLFHLYAEDFAPTVFGDLEQLLDRVTPLYKARFEELSPQMQVVAGAMANHWDPIAARQLAEATGLAPNQVSPQLDRLQKLGWVEEVELFGTARAGYQIAERFFNVWFLMRSASRRQRRQIEFLTRFLEAFYAPSDRRRLAMSLSHEHNLSPDRMTFALSLCRTLDDASTKEELERNVHLDALRQQAADARKRLDEVLDLSALPPATLAFDDLRRKLESLVPSNAEVAPMDFAREVLGSIDFFRNGERQRLAAKDHLTVDEVRRLQDLICAEREIGGRRYGQKAVDWFSQRLAGGQMRDLHDIDDWNRAFLQSPSRGKKCIRLLIDTIPVRCKPLLIEPVVARIRKSLAPNSEATATQLLEWALLLHYCLCDFNGAENAYHRAIALDPKDADPWNGLGILLQHLERDEEAEAAFRRAIELNPQIAYPWFNLGNLLQKCSGRYREAEAAYRRAIELSPKDAEPWNNLGILFENHLARYEEAEAAFRRAIELDATGAYQWYNLGNLLEDHLGRYDEAEGAFRRAIEFDPTDGSTWNELGNLLVQHFGRYDDAEAAFRRAIELNPKDTNPWNGLGNLLTDFLGRFSEGRWAFENARQLDPTAEVPFENLIFLRRDFQGDVDAAHCLFAELSGFTELEFKDSYHLHDALFAAYDANWGVTREKLRLALEEVQAALPPMTEIDWMRATAVLLHLDYGEDLLALLKERGDDQRLRPWYEAIRAHQLNDRRYLLNVAVEVRPAAASYYDDIARRLVLLPESTRRRGR